MTYTFWLGVEGDLEPVLLGAGLALSNGTLTAIRLNDPFPGIIQLGDMVDYGDEKTGRVIGMAWP